MAVSKFYKICAGALGRARARVLGVGVAEQVASAQKAQRNQGLKQQLCAQRLT